MQKGKEWRWGAPYTASQLDEIQHRWKLRFPPDLVELYLRGRPTFLGTGVIDWIKDDPLNIQERLDWPYEGLCFDLEHNDLWLPEWGVKPESLADQKVVLRKIVDRAPKLIPIFGHRYMPSEPHASGNPVLSVYQSDIIVYGASLEDYLCREMAGSPSAIGPLPAYKTVRFWSSFLD